MMMADLNRNQSIERKFSSINDSTSNGNTPKKQGKKNFSEEKTTNDREMYTLRVQKAVFQVERKRCQMLPKLSTNESRLQKRQHLDKRLYIRCAQFLLNSYDCSKAELCHVGGSRYTSAQYIQKQYCKE